MLRDHRLLLTIQPAAPLFVAGASASGSVSLLVQATASQSPDAASAASELLVEQLTVGILGTQSYTGRHHVFYNIAIDLLDPNTAPPSGPSSISTGAPWPLRAANGIQTLPFRVPLPLAGPGPPPCTAGRARIRYRLCVSVACRAAGGGRFAVRDARDVAVVAPLDPDRVARSPLRTLPAVRHALPAARRLSRASSVLSTNGPDAGVRLTATVRRDRWVAGLPLFVDVAVTNGGARRVRRLDLALEQTRTVFSHVVEGVVEQATTRMVGRQRFHAGWIARGLWANPAHDQPGPETRDERTWMMDIPRRLATVPPGA